MKNPALALTLCVLALFAACKKKPGDRRAGGQGPLWRHHFVGGSALTNDTNAALLTQIWNLPATAPFISETFDKLARAPYRKWQRQLPPGVPDGAALLRPLLDDLGKVESFSELHGSTNRPEIVVALRLEDTRAALWDTNLWRLVESWKLGTPRAVAAGKFHGWEVRFGGQSNLLQVVRGEGWTVLGLGEAPHTGLPRLLGRLSRKESLAWSTPAPWLALDADLPRLGKWFPPLTRLPLAPVSLSVVGQDGNLRTRGVMSFPNRLQWAYEPWRIPTNRIDESLISFTVAQGFAPVLDDLPLFKSLGLKRLPNQICLWGLPTMHSQTAAVIPVEDATNTIRDISRTLPAALGTLAGQQLGTFLYASNNAAILWQGFPFISPYIRAYEESGQEYLLAGMMPLSPGTNKPPPELFAQLAGRKDLAYYDWEITESRVIHGRQINTLLDLMNRRQTIPESARSQIWLLAVAPLLGNTVTEITVDPPYDLKLVRKSPLGLTGTELVTIVDWIESPGFPLTYDPMPNLTGPPPGARPVQPPF